MPESLLSKQQFFNTDGANISHLVKEGVSQKTIDEYNALTTEFRQAGVDSKTIILPEEKNLSCLSNERYRFWVENISKF